MYFYSLFISVLAQDVLRCFQIPCLYSSKQNKYYSYLNPGNQDGVVSIVTRLWSGIWILAGEKGIFSFPKYLDWLGPTQPPIQWPPGSLSPWHEVPGSWCWSLISISCWVESKCICSSSSHRCLHGMYTNIFIFTC